MDLNDLSQTPQEASRPPPGDLQDAAETPPNRPQLDHTRTQTQTQTHRDRHKTAPVAIHPPSVSGITPPVSRYQAGLISHALHAGSSLVSSHCFFLPELPLISRCGLCRFTAQRILKLLQSFCAASPSHAPQGLLPFPTAAPPSTLQKNI